MLIARPESSVESVAELMQRVRAIFAQFPDVNPDNNVVPWHGPSGLRVWLHLGVYLGMFVTGIGAFLAFTQKKPIGGFIFTAASVLCALYSRLHEAQDRKRCRADNEKVHICLGALVQANGDLYRRDNEETRYGVMVIDLGVEMDAQSEHLTEFARSLFAMKTHSLETPPELMELVAEIRDEKVRATKRTKIPKHFLGSDEILVVHVQFTPRLLPHGWLDRRLFPIMFHETDEEVPIQPVPKKYWWREDFDEILGADKPTVEEDDE